MKEIENPFDALGFDTDPEDIKKQQDELKAQGRKIDYLIHRTFEQNESGKELLSQWKETLIRYPTAQPGDDLLVVGINEGVKQFIRNILITVEKVNNE